jgi:hypothetical protein
MSCSDFAAIAFGGVACIVVVILIAVVVRRMFGHKAPISEEDGPFEFRNPAACLILALCVLSQS